MSKWIIVLMGIGWVIYNVWAYWKEYIDKNK